MNNQFSHDQGEEEKNYPTLGDDVEDPLTDDDMDDSDVEEREKPENERCFNLSSEIMESENPDSVQNVEYPSNKHNAAEPELELDRKVNEPQREPIEDNNHLKIVQLFNKNVSSSQRIFVSLTHNDFWAKLHSIGHEMKIARRGRILSPSLEYKIVGLDPLKLYAMALRFERTDNDKRLRWSTKQSPPGYIEIEDNRQIENPEEIPHPFGLQTGLFWMMKPFGFDKLRLTNTERSNDDYHIFVRMSTGHRYMPVLIIRESTGIVHTVRIRHTEFITVMVFHVDKRNERHQRGIENQKKQ
ncbi:hypothetical protein GCK72_022762 [Caenorhabditis remanei]|uniref:T-box domain-containing protein n=1 Tax=Caenorhabditis remanei TaxID=31234 RepID=A0A6A5FV15_CAERE|nr:hypothetical protein GCK72_022762 [Caenorhabditis remanei]KAF1746309.1 hypothetical protein GCK72_022762 [Caenorhabditis remanei]